MIFLLAAMAHAANPQHLRLSEPASPPPPKDVRGLLASICSGGIVADPESHGLLGCRACPKFTTSPDWENWSVAGIYYGHFTDPAADEAVAAMSGCEPHAMGFGGTALFRRDGGMWKLKWYQSGLIIQDCITVRRRDQRDLMVCANRDGGQGEFSSTLSVIDLAPPEQSREKALLTLIDNVLTCGIWGNNEAIVPLQKAAFSAVAFDPDRTSLTVKVDYGWRRITKDQANRCSAARDADQPIPKSLEPPTKAYNLTYDFDGAQFHLNPASRQSEATVKTDMPARFAPKDK